MTATTSTTARVVSAGVLASDARIYLDGAWRTVRREDSVCVVLVDTASDRVFILDQLDPVVVRPTRDLA